VLALTAYAYWLGMPVAELIPLMLIAVLGTIPVALPATFTLATAIGAQALAKSGLLPTIWPSAPRLRRRVTSSLTCGLGWVDRRLEATVMRYLRQT
jgi:magnesium-transporting ATPase (P-type)